MILALRKQLALACVLLAAPAMGGADHKDLLEQARKGNVLPAPELLAQLYGEPRGTLLTLVEAAQADLAKQPSAGIARLLEEVRKLPAEVLAQRQGLPADSRNEQVWVHGIGIASAFIKSLATPRELDSLAQILEAPEWVSAERLGPEEAPLERALRALLLRNEASYSKLTALFTRVPDWATPAYLRAISGTRTLNALRALPTLLGRRDGMDTYVLTQIASVARYARAPLEDISLGRIRSYLHSTDPHERRTAAQALGFLDDTECILDLIGLLRDTETGVRHASYGSLRLITAMTMDPGYGRWMGWHRRERTWWQEQAGTHLVVLQAGDSEGLVVALRELGSRRLFRREIGPSIRPLLSSNQVSTVRIALSALTALRVNDEETLERVAALMSHPEASVREQAKGSLTLITRRQFQLPVSRTPLTSPPTAK
ncbi:MAG: HEAT repeat protein [Planctomycetota bacterium]|jgi:HEAT repeat protein